MSMSNLKRLNIAFLLFIVIGALTSKKVKLTKTNNLNTNNAKTSFVDIDIKNNNYSANFEKSTNSTSNYSFSDKKLPSENTKTHSQDNELTLNLGIKNTNSTNWRAKIAKANYDLLYSIYTLKKTQLNDKDSNIFSNKLE